jgi:anti-sigma factor RsiW
MTYLPESTHREIQELLGVYALDAVDPDTAAMVEAHLETCPKCAVEVAQHHEVASLLANSGGAAPAELWSGIAGRLDGSVPPSWERLAERLDLEHEDGRSVDDRREGQAARVSEDDRIERSTARVVPLTSERRQGRVFRRAAAIVAVAAAVAAIVLGVQVNHLNHQVNALQAPNSLTQAERSALEESSTKQVVLTPPQTGSPTLVGRVTVVLTKSGTGFVEATGLSGLPKSETYQLWGVIGNQKISLGLLGSHPAVVPFSVAGEVPVVAFAITKERSGGVIQSTNQPVVAGEVTA